MGLPTKTPKKTKKREKHSVLPQFRDAGSEQRLLQATAQRPIIRSKFLTKALGISFLIHSSAVGVMTAFESRQSEIPQTISIRVVPKEVVVEEVKKPEPPPPKPKPKPPKKKEITSERKPKEPPVKSAPPVQGLSADALSTDGKGIAAPIGNTLMTADDGKRLKAEDVKPMNNQDMTADAKLIRSSFATPAYTDAALDASLEGTYVVDVYVDINGIVTSAELSKKVGYGMDERLLDAANKAKFEPRRDRTGKAEAGWTTISFRLELP